MKIVYAFYKQWGFIPRSHELQHGKHICFRPVLKKVTNLYNASKNYSQHSWGYKTTYPFLVVLEAESQVDSTQVTGKHAEYSHLFLRNFLSYDFLVCIWYASLPFLFSSLYPFFFFFGLSNFSFPAFDRIPYCLTS